MPEKIRNEWLKKLGKREDWDGFAAEWKKLPAEGRDEESTCYGQLLDLRQGKSRMTSTVFSTCAPHRMAAIS
jgi:soluble lytic murein transglycosylase